MSANNSDLDYILKLYRDSFYLPSHEGSGTSSKTPVRKQKLKGDVEKYTVCNLYRGILHLNCLSTVPQTILKVVSSNSHFFLSLSFFRLLQRVLANELQHHFLKKIIIQNLMNYV